MQPLYTLLFSHNPYWFILFRNPQTKLKPSNGKTEQTTIVTYELVVSDFDNPWGMSFLPNGEILVTEKSGEIKLVFNGEVIDDDISRGSGPSLKGP